MLFHHISIEKLMNVIYPLDGLELEEMSIWALFRHNVGYGFSDYFSFFLNKLLNWLFLRGYNAADGFIIVFILEECCS
jgi:hypothetical protein